MPKNFISKTSETVESSKITVKPFLMNPHWLPWKTKLYEKLGGDFKNKTLIPWFHETVKRKNITVKWIQKRSCGGASW